MFEFEANDAMIVEQQKVLEAALTTNAKTQAVLRRLIRKHILAARAEVVNGIRFKGGDPREARRAVRSSVYKRVFGANLNLFRSLKAHGSSSYEPPRTLREGKRGGNRVKRGARTQQMMQYAGMDRCMVLRWQNDGTGERTAGTRGGRLSGNRGSVPALRFFRQLGDRALGRMRDTLEQAIEEELVKLLPGA